MVTATFSALTVIANPPLRSVHRDWGRIASDPASSALWDLPLHGRDVSEWDPADRPTHPATDAPEVPPRPQLRSQGPPPPWTTDHQASNQKNTQVQSDFDLSC